MRRVVRTDARTVSRYTFAAALIGSCAAIPCHAQSSHTKARTLEDLPAHQLVAVADMAAVQHTRPLLSIDRHRDRAELMMGSVAKHTTAGRPGAPLTLPSNAQSFRPDPWLASYSPTLPGPYAAGAMPAVGVGYRHRFDERTSFNMGAVRAGGFSSQSRESLSATSFGVEYVPARNSVVGFEQANVSLKMNQSGTFAMRIKKGGPMFYLRSRF